ncbi:MAG: Gfo/Idh/MocA family oxidoreductase [Deltaproteobacteria bacterium]|nr:Gfo/Idh/MocA family oxidoreductase [Deltaproteobacteria bacterium]
MATSGKKLDVGVIGVGYFGKFHAEKYARNPHVNLVGVVDVDGERGREVAEKHNTQYFTDPALLFDKVKAVSIAVPTSLHYAVAQEFLQRGIHVLIEKPMTVTVDEARTLIDVAQSKGCVLQVGHLERFNPALYALRETLTNPRFIESHRLQSFIERATDVDVIMDLMIHDIDVILNLVKSDVKEVRANGVPVITPRIDIANARITFVNGCVANVTASRVSLKAMRKIRIFQPDAYFSIDFAKRSVSIHRKISSSEVSGFPKIVEEKISPPEHDSLEVELQAFVTAILTGTTPLVTGEDGLKALEVAKEIKTQTAAYQT